MVDMRIPSKLPAQLKFGVNPMAKPTGAAQYNLTSQTIREKGERAESLVGIATAAYSAHDEFSAQQATSKHVSTMRETDKYLSSNPFIAPEDIGEDIEFRTHDTVTLPNGDTQEVLREKIPSYEIALQLFEKNHKSSVEAQSETILSEKTKKAWTHAQNELAGEAMHDLYIKVQNAQHAEIRDLQTDQWEKHVVDRDYDLAIGVVDSMNVPDRYKRSAKEEILTIKETDVYNDAITEQNVPAIRRSITTLEDDSYSAKNSGENLDEPGRMKWVAMLRGELARITAAREANTKANFSLLKRQVQRMEQNFQNGIPVNAKEMASLANQVTSAYNIDSKAMAVHNERMQVIIRDYPTVVAFQGSPKNIREQYLISERSRGTGLTVEQGQLLGQLENVNSAMETRGNQDALQLASDVGVVDLNPMPNPLASEEAERAAFIDWVKSRRVAFDKAEDHSGEAQGLMTDAEADYFTTAFKNSSSEEQLYVMSSVSRALNTESGIFWDQLYDKGVGVFTVAGNIYAEGDTYAARLILDGMKTSELDKNILSPKIDYLPNINAYLGEAYPDEDQRAAIVNSINATYVEMAKTSGDRTGNLDEGILEAASDSVTGGIIRMRGLSSIKAMGGYSMVPPFRGYTGDQLDQHVRSTAESWWTNQQGGVFGYSGNHAKLVEDLQNGAIQYISTGEPNEYYLYSNRVNGILPYVSPKDGETTISPFIFHVDTNAEKSVEWTERRERLRSRHAGGRLEAL